MMMMMMMMPGGEDCHTDEWMDEDYSLLVSALAPDVGQRQRRSFNLLICWVNEWRFLFLFLLLRLSVKFCFFFSI